MKRLVLATCAAVLLATPVFAQVDFSRYVALGDSLTAGFASGGLTEYYQTRSYPAVLAAQAGAADFEIPTVTAPGFPPLMALVSLDPTVFETPTGAPGVPTNAELARPYNNLGVPQFTLYNMLFTPGDINNLLAGNIDNPFADLILRIPQVPDPATGELMDFTAITQAIALDPTFLTLWIGNNDILTAAVYGTPIEGVTMTPVETFQQMYGMAAGSLATYTSADMVFMTLPDVTSIAFVHAVEPFVDVPGVGRVPVLSTDPETGEVVPLSEDHLLTLYAKAFLEQGIGLPTPIGTGQPLPDDLARQLVLHTDWLQVIRENPRLPTSLLRPQPSAVAAQDLFRGLAAALEPSALSIVRRLVGTIGAPERTESRED